MKNPPKNSRRPQVLKFYYDSDPILREKCRRLTPDEVLTPEIQNLIDDIKHTCDARKAGVAMSANQVGEAVAISVIAIKPTPVRPNLEPFDTVCINTEITETFGDKELLWEGCQSTLDENGEPAMAEVPRHTKIRVKYLDRNGVPHEEIVEGFVAHVVQHETDHLNGKLMTDLISADSLISYREYMERLEEK
ncbi:peptide deformylase [Alphaproteobacteria bacterium]|nr:peptide deformylase [Alphaproteobacteria bacterium]